MDKLRVWRNGTKLTAKDAGERIGVSGVQWTRYETGERSVSMKNLNAVSELTGIPAHELRPDIFEAIGLDQPEVRTNERT